MTNNEYVVFYADDDKDDLDFFRDVTDSLTSSNVQLFTHNDVDSLLGALVSPPPIPQVIFLDLNMPGKNGFDALQELKQNLKLKDIPVVIFSTSSDEQSVSKSLSMGASFYVTKSTTFATLKKSIEYTLGINWKTFEPSSQNFIYKNEN
ncbi:MAG: response regulator [Flavobacterium sp.]